MSTEKDLAAVQETQLPGEGLQASHVVGDVVQQDQALTEFEAAITLLGFERTNPGRYSFKKALPPGINTYTLTIGQSRHGLAGSYSAILRSDPFHQEHDYVPPSSQTLSTILEAVQERVSTITETKDF